MSDNQPGRFTFTTDALPERDRFPAFCEGMFRHVVGADIVRLGAESFRGSIDARRAGGVLILDIATTSADLIRGTGYTADGNDDIVVQMWRQGRASATQGPCEQAIGASDGLVIDNARAARIRVEDPCRFWGLAIPRGRIPDAGGNMDRRGEIGLPPSSALGLLCGYLEGTLAQDFAGDAAAELFGNHLIDLVAVALGRGGDAGELAAQGGVPAARLAAILRAITDQSADPQLNAAAVAAQIGITPRYVHLLLEQSGRSFTQHLLQTRLEKAAELLAADAGRRVGDIAIAAGFTDLSHFNRSFRRRFGDTPSGLRAVARRRGDV
jgi:AraC-like DNA-binding protein